MSGRVIVIAEWKARREAEIVREHMSGSWHRRAPRLTLGELLGWPPMRPAGE